MSNKPGHAVYKFLDTAGNGTGTKNAVGDYSSSPGTFYYQPDTPTRIHRLVIHIEDTTGMQAQEYGNLGGALSAGYSLIVQNDLQQTQVDLCDGVPIKTNAGIGRYCYDVDLKSWGAGNEMLQARWTFSRAGYPLYLYKDWRLSITFNDNLSGLLEHYFMIQGYAV